MTGPVGPDEANPLAYAERARAGLTRLGELFGREAGFDEQVDSAVAALFQGWGHRVSQSGGAEPERAPYEYSVALSPGGGADLRVFFRPLPDSGASSPLASWEQGWRILAGLERDAGVPLLRARQLAELFTPASAQAASGLCLAASVGPGGVVGVKVYFDGVAAGLPANGQLMGRALELLGYPEVWDWLTRHYPDGVGQLMPSFAVDMSDAPGARIKLYTFVQEATPAELETRLTALPGYVPGRAADFATAVGADETVGFIEPRARPMLCWSVTERSRSHPDDVTLYLPFNAYVPDAERAVDRLSALLDPEQLGRVDALCGHVASIGPAVNPFHWAAVKLNRPAGSGLALYFAAGLVDPPLTVPSGVRAAG